MAAPRPRRGGIGQDGSLRLEGQDRFLALGQALNRAGNGEVLRELKKAVQQAAKPLTPASRAKARSILPSSGGLAERVARAPQRVTARTGGSTASVKFTIGRKGSGARGAEVGNVRHPVFGNRRRFVAQPVTPKWFSGTANEKRGEVREGIREVLDEFTERITRGV